MFKTIFKDGVGLTGSIRVYPSQKIGRSSFEGCVGLTDSLIIEKNNNSVSTVLNYACFMGTHFKTICIPKRSVYLYNCSLACPKVERIISKVAIPDDFHFGRSIFDAGTISVDFDACILEVPKGTTASYKKKEDRDWAKFKKIVEVGEATAIQMTALDQVACIQKDGVVTIIAPEAIKKVLLYDMRGRLLKTIEVENRRIEFSHPQKGAALVKLVWENGVTTVVRCL